MSSSLLKVPFKKVEDLPTSFLNILKGDIAQVFEEDPTRYSVDFSILEALRHSIHDPQVHESSANTHLEYYAQLHYMETKFDVSEESEKFFWTWANAFGKQDCVSSHNIGFEKASVLFNLAAIYSHLGVTTGIDGEVALKKSAAYFQQSAGTFQTIVDRLPTWGIEGAANTQLNALVNLMLAQAQEVFLSKAISTKMKEGTLAKLAMQVSTFYNVAHDIAADTTVIDKTWLAHMKAKQYHHAAIGQYYKGMDSEANGKYGEQIAWLASSVASIKSALDKQIVKLLPLLSLETEMKTFSAMVDVAFQKAEKDNDKIYMEMVPKELPPLPPARMVNPALVPEVSAIQVPRAVFRNLVPLTVHMAASKYASKKDSLIKHLSAKLSEATAIAHTTLASQKLPGAIEALEQPIGLPEIVLERSEEVRQKGGPRYIETSWSTLATFARQDRQILTECTSMLAREQAEDDEMRRLYGPRWTRTPSVTLTVKLRERADEYNEKIEVADKSNAVVRAKIDSNMFLIEHLAMNKRELEASIPSGSPSSTLALKDPNLQILKANLESLNKNLRQRPEIVTRLKKLSEKDDIGPRLTQSALSNEIVDESVLFDQQIKVYDEDAKLIKTLIGEQDRLLDVIFNANKTFMDSHKTNEMIREREAALSNLDVAYRHFDDISGNVEEGIKFFSELEAVLKKFQGFCLDFVKARALDKDQLLAQIQMGGIAISGGGGGAGNHPTSSYNNSLPAPGVWNQAQQQPQYQQPNQPVHYNNAPPPQSQQQPGIWNPSQQQQHQQQQQQYGQQPQQLPPPAPYGQQPQLQQQQQLYGNLQQPLQPQYPHQQLPGSFSGR